MSKQGTIIAEGTVQKALSNGMFAVELDNGHELTCHLNGLMRKNFIRIIPGDRVEVEPLVPSAVAITELILMILGLLANKVQVSNMSSLGFTPK